jgi:GNAT superfamily N-acetyltransferase
MVKGDSSPEKRMIRTYSTAMARSTQTLGASQVRSDLVYRSISHIERHYPGFRDWYFGKVVPGLRDGSRAVFAHSVGSRLAGIAIAKRGEEQKLCTLWVHPSVRSSGVGTSLAQKAFDWLENDKPLFTIPLDKYPEFEGLLDRWQFTEAGRVKDQYRPNSTECVFNRALSSASLL